MSTTTSKYGFVLPSLNDAPPDITVFNQNFTKIENELSALDARIDVPPTAESIGAVKKTGDTMTGNLVVSKSDVPRLDATNTTTGRTARMQSTPSGYAEFGNVGVNGHLRLVLDTETSALDAMIQLNRTNGDSSVKYKLYGEHNQPYTYGTTDLTAGVSALAAGKLYFVYE